ncbi:MAG: glycine C-acetyltransferase, partial [Bacteroidota bacterium]
MFTTTRTPLQAEIDDIKNAGLYKEERIITTPQAAEIATTSGKEVLNFCANNYLGLSSHPDVIKAAKAAIDTHGFG